MAFSTRVSLSKGGRTVFEYEPTYWASTSLVDELGLIEAKRSDSYFDWMGTFSRAQALALEHRFWEARHFRGYEGAFTATCAGHETMVRLLSDGAEVDEVHIRVFEWESGLD